MSGDTAAEAEIRLEAHRRAHGHTKAEVVDDLVDMLLELSDADDKQDRELVDQVRQKYGWRL